MGWAHFSDRRNAATTVIAHDDEIAFLSRFRARDEIPGRGIFEIELILFLGAAFAAIFARAMRGINFVELRSRPFSRARDVMRVKRGKNVFLSLALTAVKRTM